MQTIIHNVRIVNDNKIFDSDIYFKNGIIERIDPSINVKHKVDEIKGDGLILLPGIIDDQVHFREPGLTHKGDIASESAAAVAGGITSFMDMPNTVPNTLTQELLEEKYRLAQKKSWANYSFYMGAGNNNLDEVLKTNRENVCGVKIFMGSSTGDMLVDNPTTLDKIFSQSPMLIATHCEDEQTIRQNTEKYKSLYGDKLNASHHPLIRSEEACYLSSSFAVNLAKKYNTRLHILHISTARETELFSNNVPLKDKRITSEACIHHLWFDDNDYASKGNFIKWNPAIKTQVDKEAILNALLSDKIDVIATDHAPHTLDEKQMPYLKAPSGGPLVQHALVAMLELFHQGKISLEQIANKMCHSPAICFNIKNRGFIQEGFAADVSLVNLNEPWTVAKSNILYKCGWSPFEGTTFQSKVKHTFVNGVHIYNDGHLQLSTNGQRLLFSSH
ncbi:MAG TPA: dihydroorotase [Bacteroidia bacterium]|nr:dihydroorotase [Bacteroidia bacterium]MBP7713155.1 dihydroorotase [Bacteroidia bacterium]MBP8668756.1 dihydroorotase [Bacteroidia bacterium]HOZ81455.1 dihydroorotase [Bacteroidia bacterium]HOZ90723.1 dihydroorotase [Bacteroidia bacterium]